jgi:hypothetical protein
MLQRIGSRGISKITGFRLLLIYGPTNRSGQACGLYQQVLLASEENYQLSTGARLDEVKSPFLIGG